MFRESPILRWRGYNDRYKLKGYKCRVCKKVYFEKKGLCPCGSIEFDEIELSGKGKIAAFTQIHGAPEAFESKAPYCVAVIDLAEGARIEAQVVDCKYSDLKIGTDVEAVFRKFYSSGEKGAIHYGTKFVPKF
ncbi:MAG: Zn-ribbon domain-containing OB-fold protein [Candidatus Diapherotrites archaeon]|nr:Zn-ribbon domain-containing OB-fold protein [Candidatus Diapherotrites archaeon]